MQKGKNTCKSGENSEVLKFITEDYPMSPVCLILLMGDIKNVIDTRAQQQIIRIYIIFH